MHSVDKILQGTERIPGNEAGCSCVVPARGDREGTRVGGGVATKAKTQDYRREAEKGDGKFNGGGETAANVV
jgi:hypothetical protein